MRPPGLPRALPHPGPRSADRLLVQPTQTVSVTGRLRSDERLVDELIRLTAGLGVTSGSVSFSAGVLATLNYCFPAEGTGQRAAWFSPEQVAHNAQLTGGSATVGLREGMPFVHAHLRWRDKQGVTQGGHIWPGTVVGSPAPEVTVSGLRAAEWESITDPETMMPAFQPRSRHSSQGPASEPQDFAVARVLPDEDITEAVRDIGRKSGFDAVRVVAGLGSLIGGVLVSEEGHRVVIDGPATEVITLSGTIEGLAPSAAAPEPRAVHQLHCTLVDLHGTVHSGYLIPGENPVAVTFELLLASA